MLYNLTKVRFPNDTSLNAFTTFTQDQLQTYGTQIQLAMGVAQAVNATQPKCVVGQQS
jgi:hypothetical protein